MVTSNASPVNSVQSNVHMQVQNAAAASSLVNKATKNEREKGRDDTFHAIRRTQSPYLIRQVVEVDEKQGLEESSHEMDTQRRNTQYRSAIQNIRPKVTYDNTALSEQVVRINTPHPMPERMGRLVDQMI